MGDVYDRPLLYDIAFSYRDFPVEVDALGAFFARASGRPTPSSVLELASGPADHAIEWSRRGIPALALDRSEAMCEYVRAKAGPAGVEVRRADMIDFALGRRFDLALLMCNSLAHIHSMDDLVRHLRSAAAHLEASGVYVLEIQHPRHFVGRSTRPAEATLPWTVERFGLEVETRWGSPEDPYDPSRQLFDARVEFRIRDGASEERFTERCLMRDWTLMELEAAVAISEAFEIAAVHGDFEAEASFDAESWRMIVVLRRR